MPVQLDDFIRLYQLPSGRAAYAARQALAAAQGLGDTDAAARAEVSLLQASVTRDLELRHRKAAVQPLYGPRAPELDAQLDRALSAMDTAISARLAIATGPDDADPAAVAAARLQRELLPRGVSHVTSLSYVEEHESVTLLVKRLTSGGDASADAATLGLEPFIQRIQAVNAELGAELSKAAPPSTPTWDTIRAERAKLQAGLLSLVATVLGRYAGDDAQSSTARDAILGPIWAQQQALAALFRSKRGVRDIDPTTGDEEEALLPAAEEAV
jgi:hypothetical protein